MAEFYDKPLDYAKANGELDKWRSSMHISAQPAALLFR